jgi:hypothetical protein
MMQLTLAGGLQGRYIGSGNDPFLSAQASRRRASLRLLEVSLYFKEFESTYNSHFFGMIRLYLQNLQCCMVQFNERRA